MSDEPKVFSLPPSREPTLLGSGNGHNPHFPPPSGLAHKEGPKPNLKHAFFYLAVASLLILSNRLDRVSEAPNSNSTRPSLQDATLVLHPPANAERLVSVSFPVRPCT